MKYIKFYPLLLAIILLANTSFARNRSRAESSNKTNVGNGNCQLGYVTRVGENNFFFTNLQPVSRVNNNGPYQPGCPQVGINDEPVLVNGVAAPVAMVTPIANTDRTKGGGRPVISTVDTIQKKENAEALEGSDASEASTLKSLGD